MTIQDDWPLLLSAMLRIRYFEDEVKSLSPLAS